MGLISRVSSRTYRSRSQFTMADYKDNKVQEELSSNIRITISATNARAVDKACSEITGRAKSMNNNPNNAQPVKIKGPRPMPTRHMRINKRIIEFECARTQILNITHVKLEPGVHVEL